MLIETLVQVRFLAPGKAVIAFDLIVVKPGVVLVHSLLAPADLSQEPLSLVVSQDIRGGIKIKLEICHIG